MVKIRQILLLALTAGLIISCGTTERGFRSDPQTASAEPESRTEPLPSAINVSGYSEVISSLYQAHRNWKGTPYKYGGTTNRGIDCSAFMQIVFDSYFNIELPRNTKRQLYSGRSVRRNALKTGDLVFFKTGRKTLHVGVVIEGDDFLHVSTSQGVTISSMDDYYWRSRYRAGRRIL